MELKHALWAWSFHAPWPDLDHDHAFLYTSEAVFQPFLRVEKRFSDRTAELSRWMALSSITTV